MSGGGWKYAASSVIGTSHKNNPDGLCQDAHMCRYLEGIVPALLAVVSDGAGSASHSHLGSRGACEYVETRVRDAPSEERFTQSFALDVFQCLRQQLFKMAEEAGLTARDLACTLLVAIVEGCRAAFWQIGDGAICFRIRESETYGYAFWPEKGDYANVTYFVTDANAEEHLEFDVMAGEIIELAAFSDGLERLALDFAAGETHSGFFKGLFPHLSSVGPGYSAAISSQLAAFLGSERVNKRTDDDKTLILAARTE